MFKIPPRRISILLSIGVITALALSAYRFWRLRFYDEFMDETDNILIGWLITRGYRLYSDVFSQHTPTGYMIGHLVAALSPHRFEYFRIPAWVAYVMVSFAFALSPIFSQRRREAVGGAIALLLTLAALAPIWRGYFLLVDTIWGAALSVSVLWIFLPAMSTDPPSSALRPRLAFAGGLSIALFQSGSQATIYLLPFTAGFAFLIWKRFPPKIFFAVGLGTLSGMVLYALWVFRYASFTGLYAQAIELNRQFYAHYLAEASGRSDSTVLGFFWYSLRQTLELHWNAIFSPRDWLAFDSIYSWLMILISVNFSRGFRMRGIVVGGVWLFLAASRARGGGFHGAPFYVLVTTLFWVVLTRDFSRQTPIWPMHPRWGLFMTVMFFLVFSARHVIRDSSWTARADALEQSLQLSPSLEYIRSHTRPSDKIAVFPCFPILFFLADREPAVSATTFTPWQKDWEDTHPPGVVSTCDQLKASRPPMIWIDEWTVWKRPFAEYGRCLDQWIRAHYRRVDEPGIAHLYVWNSRGSTPPAR